MKVDFNSLRIRALKAHDRLVETLNEHLTDSGATVVVDADQIESDLNDLRELLCTLASTYEEGKPEFADVFSQHYPEGKGMAVFNPEPEEDDDDDA